MVAGYVDMPVEQRPSWQAYTTQEPFHIQDWNSDERIPARLKEGIAGPGGSSEILRLKRTETESDEDFAHFIWHRFVFSDFCMG